MKEQEIIMGNIGGKEFEGGKGIIYHDRSMLRAHDFYFILPLHD